MRPVLAGAPLSVTLNQMRTSEKKYVFPPDIEAEITFVRAEDGGRSTPAFSGYRPQFFYDGHDWDADQEFPDVQSALPGQTVRALLRFLSPEMHVGRLNVGMEFQVREGPRVVARGRVTKILDLDESARRNQGKR
jgi:translation elongation factor EF-Tu-like GTPase